MPRATRNHFPSATSDEREARQNERPIGIELSRPWQAFAGLKPDRHQLASIVRALYNKFGQLGAKETADQTSLSKRIACRAGQRQHDGIATRQRLGVGFV